MTHPIGSIIFDPQPGFSFPRSYCKVIDVFTNSDNPPTLVGGLITLSSFSVPTFKLYIGLAENFIPFSNTGFTLKYLFKFWYYQYHPTDPETAYFGVVRFKYIPALQQHGLIIETDSPDTHHYFQLAKPPSSYWLPPELGD
jgi:hypothetical protein